MALGADNSWVPIVVQAGVSLLLLLVFLVLAGGARTGATLME
jgi:hypothetical protein